MFCLIIIPLCRDSAMNLLTFLVSVEMCGARGWSHMPFCTQLKSLPVITLANVDFLTLAHIATIL